MKSEESVDLRSRDLPSSPSKNSGELVVSEHSPATCCRWCGQQLTPETVQHCVVWTWTGYKIRVKLPAGGSVVC